MYHGKRKDRTLGREYHIWRGGTSASIKKVRRMPRIKGASYQQQRREKESYMFSQDKANRGKEGEEGGNKRFSILKIGPYQQTIVRNGRVGIYKNGGCTRNGTPASRKGKKCICCGHAWQ